LGFLKSFELLGSGMDQLPELTHKRIDSYYFDLESRSEGNYTDTELAILNGIYSRVLGTISEWNKYAETLMQEPYTVACGYGARYFAGYFDSIADDATLFEIAFS
jgi:hypothetical protein